MKLSDQEIEEMKKKADLGQSVLKIALQYGIDRKTVYYHIQKKSKYIHKTTKKQFKCITCGIEFLGFGKRKYCSLNCRNKNIKDVLKNIQKKLKLKTMRIF